MWLKCEIYGALIIVLEQHNGITLLVIRTSICDCVLLVHLRVEGCSGVGRSSVYQQIQWSATIIKALHGELWVANCDHININASENIDYVIIKNK